jgi:putative heme-binding domain-containing protein
LLKLHSHRSQWYVRHARQELVRRSTLNDSLLLQLSERLEPKWAGSFSEHAALEALWTRNALKPIDADYARLLLLDSSFPAVRAWTLRCLGDPRTELPEALAHRLDEFAEQETEVGVLQQLACTARRLPAHQAVPIINANINRDDHNDDPYLPLLWWWAVEEHSVSGREEVLKRFVRPTLWKSELGRDFLLPRLIRRYAAEGTVAGLDSVVRLLKAAPTDADRAALWPPILLGWGEVPADAYNAGWLLATYDHEISKLLVADWHSAPQNPTLLQLAITIDFREAFNVAFRDAFDATMDEQRRIALLRMLGPTADSSLVSPAWQLAESDSSDALRSAALGLVAQFDDPGSPMRLIALHQSSISESLKSQIRDILLGRPSSARAWLEAVDRGEIKPDVTPVDQIRKVALLNDADLDALVKKHWGNLAAATPEEKLAEVRRLNNDVRAATGDAAAGKVLFTKNCATCHQLFGEGQKVGPDLTTANRQDRDFLLVSLVDPSSVVRKEYVSLVIATRSGRVVTGLPIDRSGGNITLVDSKGEKSTLAESEVDELEESTVSLMPDNLYRQFRPQELRDLFAYLQSQPAAQ